MSNDGGPAFPCSNEQFTYGNPQTGDAWPGMGLRDWFAGQAMVAIIIGNNADAPSLTVGAAKDAYAMADAMLAARSEAEGRQP